MPTRTVELAPGEVSLLSQLIVMVIRSDIPERLAAHRVRPKRRTETHDLLFGQGQTEILSNDRAIQAVLESLLIIGTKLTLLKNEYDVELLTEEGT